MLVILTLEYWIEIRSERLRLEVLEVDVGYTLKPEKKEKYPRLFQRHFVYLLGLLFV